MYYRINLTKGNEKDIRLLPINITIPKLTY